MYLAKIQQPQEMMPPLPPATLIIDARGKGGALIQMLGVEVKNLTEEMRLHKVDLWNRLSDFIAYETLNLLSEEDINVLRQSAQKEKGEGEPDDPSGTNQSVSTASQNKTRGRTLTGEVEPRDTLSSFPPQYQANYRRLPFENPDEDRLLSYGGFERLIDIIDRIRNIRHNAVSELGKSGTVGHNIKEAGVRVIFLADARQTTSLNNTAACAWYLKRYYKRLERPDERTGRQIPINVSVLCLNHQNTDQDVAPSRLIKGLHWDNSWEHLDAVILSERYRQDIGRVDENVQQLFAELLLYTLLIVSPTMAQINAEPPDPSTDNNVDDTEEQLSLPENTYLVGMASVENSTRWGYLLLNYGMAEQALKTLLEEDLGNEQATIAGNIEAWLNAWVNLVRSALPDNLPGESLNGIIKAQSASLETSKVLTNSQLSLNVGERTLEALDTYLKSLCTTYVTSDNEQATVSQRARVHASGLEMFLIPTLQTAVDSVPQIERALDEWQKDGLVNPLTQAQITAQRVLSHDPFFLGPHKAIPRAKLQLKELAAAIGERRNKRQKRPVDVKAMQKQLQQSGTNRINQLRDHIDAWPLLAARLKARDVLAWLNAAFFVFLVVCGATLGLAWLEVFLLTHLAGVRPFLTAPILGLTSFTTFYLLLWIISIILFAIAVLISGRVFLDKKHSPLTVEITFCVFLLGIFLAGLLFELSYVPLTDSGVGIGPIAWFPTGLVPWITVLSLIALIIIIIAEVFYFFRWRAELARERELIIKAMNEDHEKNIQEVMSYITDLLSFHILEQAWLIDRKGGSGAYYKRLDDLQALLQSVKDSTVEQRQLAEQRLGSDLDEASLKLREELINVAALKRGYLRLGTHMDKELAELASILLRTMGQEAPGDIEQDLRVRTPHDNREQYYVQLLMETFTAAALRLAIAVPATDILTPLRERYTDLDGQVTQQLASLEPLIDILMRKIASAGLDIEEESNGHRRAKDYDIELARQAFAAWGQMLWEGRDSELSDALAPGGVIARLIRDKHKPQTIKEKLGIRTSLSGRTMRPGRYDDLYLLVAPSPERRRFLKDFLPDSYFADFPDEERLILLHILHYAAKPTTIPRKKIASGGLPPVVEGSTTVDEDDPNDPQTP